MFVAFHGDRPPPCRFDIVSIILEGDGGKPQITVHKGAFSWDADKPRNYWRQDFRDRQLLAAKMSKAGLRPRTCSCGQWIALPRSIAPVDRCNCELAHMAPAR